MADVTSGALPEERPRPSATARTEVQLRSILATLPSDLRGALAAFRHVDDWDALLSAAQEHGVDGVLMAAARSTGFAPQHRARATWEKATDRIRQGALWGDVLNDTLHAVLKALGGHDVPVVVLKGPVLAARLYGEESVRPSTDLDLLVDPSSLDRAALALKPLGYVLEGGEAGRFFRDHHHHVHVLHATLPTLELHFDAYRGFGTSLPSVPLLARSVPSDAADWVEARILAPEDEFLYLAVHAASHRFERLMWLFDLKLLALRHPDLRWDLVAARARSHRLSAVVSFACELLTDWIGTPSYGVSDLRRIGAARRFIAKRLVGRRSNHGVNAAADLFFCTLLCEDVIRAAALSGRFARIKLLHEGPRRVRSRLSS